VGEKRGENVDGRTSRMRESLLAPFLTLLIFGGALFTYQYVTKEPIPLQWIQLGVLLCVGWILFSLKKQALHALPYSPNQVDVIDKLLTALFLLLLLCLFFEVLGVGLSTLLAFGGVSGLALAFASQQVVSNFFGGLMIYCTHPFKIGDFITLPEKEVEGHVERIGWYTTQLRSLDKRSVSIPNSTFSSAVVINPSRKTYSLFKETIGLRYQDFPQLEKVIVDIRKMVDKHPETAHDLPKIIRFHTFGVSSIDILVQFYLKPTSPEDLAKIREEILFAIAAILQRHHAELAYPTYTLLQHAP